MPAKWKYKEVEELTKLLKESPVTAVAGIEGLPSKQMQEIRAKLHGQLRMKVVKNRLAKMAFEKAGVKGIKELEERVEGPTALIFADTNPFKLYQKFKENRVNAPAKAGQKAPTDIVVPAGDTPFKPGPIIGDLQAVGIKAKIQGPIIVVQEDSPVIKEGEKFSPQLANVLAQMDIKPMEIGVNIKAALEKGTVYDSEILDVSAEDTISQIMAAHQNAINLAVETGYPTKESMEIMLTKAAGEARNLAIEAEIYNEETVDYFLSKGDREAKGLAASVDYTPGEKPEAPKEEKKEEKAEEEPKSEAKAEGSTEAAEEISKDSDKEDKAVEKDVTEGSKKEAPKEEKKEEDGSKKSEESKEDEAIAEDEQEASEEKAEEKLVEEADPVNDAPKEEKKESS